MSLVLKRPVTLRLVDVEKDMRWARVIRLLYALPSEAMLAALSSGAAFLAVAATLVVPKMEDHPWLVYFLIGPLMVIAGCGLLLVIVILIFRMFFEYQRRTYDFATIAPLVTTYDSEAMETKWTLGVRKTLEIVDQGGWKNIDRSRFGMVAFS